MEKENKHLILKVWKAKANNQKLVVIPRESDIKEGDYIEVIKIK